MNVKRLKWLTLLVAMPLAAACEYVIPDRPVMGYEADDVSCDDGWDNDRDGLTDCEDPDCFYESVHCGEDRPNGYIEKPEDSLLRCHDNIDNDGDGQYDCADRSCQDIRETCCWTHETTNAACSDGVDNDQDGRIDCDDFKCYRGMFVTVCDGPSSGGSSAPSCADDQLGAENTVARCSDGCDNDGNGFLDCDDFSCSGTQAPPETQQYCAAQAGSLVEEDTAELCGDGVDNDGDGYADCADFSCQDIPSFCQEENTPEACRDGEDNDGNGYTDCDDRECTALGAAVCPVEDTFELCSDGIDNDGNGYVDCQDYSCAQARTAAVRMACQESVWKPSDVSSSQTFASLKAAAQAACSDGVDNDGDGFADCDDWDCSWNPLLHDEATGAHVICPGFKVCEEYEN